MYRTFALFTLVLLAACDPSGQRPGLWLTGSEAPFPDDWSFTDQHPEIFIEVATPYLLPHSVTIWCAQRGGTLFVGAQAPETKHWPGWVDDDPEVRLKIGDAVYPVHLAALSDPAQIAAVQQAYAAKYRLSGGLADAGQRYWRVEPRA